jgi:hypothetical protein
MQSHRCVVHRKPKLRRYLRHGHTFNDDTPENGRVHGLQLRGLHKNATAVQALILEGHWLEIFDRQNGLPTLSKFIDQDVAYDPSEPCLDPREVVHLVRPLERPLNRDLEDFLSIDLRTTPPTDHGKQPFALRAHSVVNRAGSRERGGRQPHCVLLNLLPFTVYYKPLKGSVGASVRRRKKA